MATNSQMTKQQVIFNQKVLVMTKSKYIQKKEVANILGISPSSVIRWVKTKDLPKPFQFGHKTVWDIDEVYAWIEKQKQTRGFAKPKSTRDQNVNKTQ